MLLVFILLVHREVQKRMRQPGKSFTFKQLGGEPEGVLFYCLCLPFQASWNDYK